MKKAGSKEMGVKGVEEVAGARDFLGTAIAIPVLALWFAGVPPKVIQRIYG